jgi:FtsZ-interacting cell division protein ZipA
MYALGFVWGPMDLFYWYDASEQTRLLTISRLGQPGTFLPERAEEGEGIPGLVFSFELPACPAPVTVFERMAIALAHLREPLHGRPVTRDGKELDSDRLQDMRDEVAHAEQELKALGLAPGSPQAKAFF